MRGADREARHAALHKRKVDKLDQRLLKRRGRVEPGFVLSQGIVRAQERERIGLEEARNAAEQSRPIGRGVGQPGPGRETPKLLAPHPAPEFLQPVETIFALIAGNEARIDRADGGADDPVRLDFRFVERLVNAGLVRAERAPALKDEDDRALLRCGFLPWRWSLLLAIGGPRLHDIQHLFLPNENVLGFFRPSHHKRPVAAPSNQHLLGLADAVEDDFRPRGGQRADHTQAIPLAEPSRATLCLQTRLGY